jgi:hypothetical protein
MIIRELKEKIRSVSEKTGITEGFLMKLLEPLLKKSIKKDPNVQSAYKKAYKAAQEFEDAYAELKRKNPNLDQKVLDKYFRRGLN